MEQILKETAKKAPVVTAIFVFPIVIISKVLDKPIPDWILFSIVLLTFLLSFGVLYFHYSSKNKASNKISGQAISNIDTEGGDFSLGTTGKSKSNLNITDNKIKGVKTGGGDFTIGSKVD